MQQQSRGNNFVCPDFNDGRTYRHNGTTNDEGARDYNGSYKHNGSYNHNGTYEHTINQHGFIRVG